MFKIKISDILINKKYLLVYFISLLFFLAIFYRFSNFYYIKFHFLNLLIIFIGGSFALIYYSKTKNLHRTCFIILLIFGLVMILTTPSFIVCDEIEHYARSDLTAQGILFPEYINNEGYNVSSNFNHLLAIRGSSILDPAIFNDNVAENHSLFNGCFPQNPFYPYLLSGLGILLAKLLNLSDIFSMYIGRFLNLLFYCVICSFAIKKATEYKLPIFLVSCIPLCLYQAASFNVDGFIISMTLLAIAYFINIYKSEIVSNKDLGVFFALILLVSLLKLPYVLLVLLIFLIKKDRFTSKRVYLISRIIPIIIIIVCAVYSYNASKLLKYTIRNDHFIEHHVNPGNQFVNMINHPHHTFVLFSSIFAFTQDMIWDLFRFSYEKWTCASKLLASLYFVFFTLFTVTYNTVKIKFKRNYKIFLAFILLVIYIGIIFIQYLSWAPFAYPRLDMNIGVYSRYYLPLFAFLPLVFSPERIISKLKIDNYELKVILGCLIFLSGTIIFTLSVIYKF